METAAQNEREDVPGIKNAWWESLKRYGRELAQREERLFLLLAPCLTGLFIGILVKRFFPQVRGSGVNQTKTAVYISDGFIPFHTVIGKFFCSALVIGGGHSLGPEDPSLQIGAGIASAIGRRLRLSREN